MWKKKHCFENILGFVVTVVSQDDTMIACFNGVWDGGVTEAIHPFSINHQGRGVLETISA